MVSPSRISITIITGILAVLYLFQNIIKLPLNIDFTFLILYGLFLMLIFGVEVFRLLDRHSLKRIKIGNIIEIEKELTSISTNVEKMNIEKEELVERLKIIRNTTIWSL